MVDRGESPKKKIIIDTDSDKEFILSKLKKNIVQNENI